MNNLNRICFSIASAFVLVALTGCGGGPSGDEIVSEANSSNIQRLANLYLGFQNRNNFIGPADETEFKEFISKLNGKKLERMGVDANDIGAVFVSERDNEPFKIRYSVLGSAKGCSHPVIFESVGVEGSRMIGFLNMSQKEAGSSEYDELWSKELGEVVSGIGFQCRSLVN